MAALGAIQHNWIAGFSCVSSRCSARVLTRIWNSKPRTKQAKPSLTLGALRSAPRVARDKGTLHAGPVDTSQRIPQAVPKGFRIDRTR
jgi:hypothetical protein